MREPTTMGRPREFDEDDVLVKILDVFWAQGFEGTTMTDLVAATGLKKGSLYAAFGDKRTMYLCALARYERTAVDGAVRLLTGAGTPKKRIGAFLQTVVDAVTERGDRRGCFLCNASVDQAMLNPQAEQAVQSGLNKLAGALDKALPPASHAAQRRGRATHLLAVYFGMRVLAKGGHPVTAIKGAKDAALSGL